MAELDCKQLAQQSSNSGTTAVAERASPRQIPTKRMPASEKWTAVRRKQRSGLYERQAAAQLKRGQVQQASMGHNGPKTKVPCKQPGDRSPAAKAVHGGDGTMRHTQVHYAASAFALRQVARCFDHIAS